MNKTTLWISSMVLTMAVVTALTACSGGNRMAGGDTTDITNQAVIPRYHHPATVPSNRYSSLSMRSSRRSLADKASCMSEPMLRRRTGRLRRPPHMTALRFRSAGSGMAWAPTR